MIPNPDHSQRPKAVKNPHKTIFGRLKYRMGNIFGKNKSSDEEQKEKTNGASKEQASSQGYRGKIPKGHKFTKEPSASSQPEQKSQKSHLHNYANEASANAEKTGNHANAALAHITASMVHQKQKEHADDTKTSEEHMKKAYLHHHMAEKSPTGEKVERAKGILGVSSSHKTNEANKASFRAFQGDKKDSSAMSQHHLNAYHAHKEASNSSNKSLSNNDRKNHTIMSEYHKNQAAEHLHKIKSKNAHSILFDNLVHNISSSKYGKASEIFETIMTSKIIESMESKYEEISEAIRASTPTYIKGLSKPVSAADLKKQHAEKKAYANTLSKRASAASEEAGHVENDHKKNDATSFDAINAHKYAWAMHHRAAQAHRDLGDKQKKSEHAKQAHEHYKKYYNIQLDNEGPVLESEIQENLDAFLMETIEYDIIQENYDLTKKAHEASAKADLSSETAKKENTFASHKTAMEHHLDAKEAHRAIGNKQNKVKHAKEATAHREKANEYGKKEGKPYIDAPEKQERGLGKLRKNIGGKGSLKDVDDFDPEEYERKAMLAHEKDMLKKRPKVAPKKVRSVKKSKDEDDDDFTEFGKDDPSEREHYLSKLKHKAGVGHYYHEESLEEAREDEDGMFTGGPHDDEERKDYIHMKKTGNKMIAHANKLSKSASTKEQHLKAAHAHFTTSGHWQDFLDKHSIYTLDGEPYEKKVERHNNKGDNHLRKGNIGWKEYQDYQTNIYSNVPTNESLDDIAKKLNSPREIELSPRTKRLSDRFHKNFQKHMAKNAIGKHIANKYKNRE